MPVVDVTEETPYRMSGVRGVHRYVRPMPNVMGVRPALAEVLLGAALLLLGGGLLPGSNRPGAVATLWLVAAAASWRMCTLHRQRLRVLLVLREAGRVRAAAGGWDRMTAAQQREWVRRIEEAALS